VVTDIYPAEHITEQELLTLANALESKSEHPLAHAIVEKAKEEDIEVLEIRDFTIQPGNGLEAVLVDEQYKDAHCVNCNIYGGNRRFIESKLPDGLDSRLKLSAEKIASEGKTPLFFGRGETILGMIAVADTIKEDSPKAIRELQNMGIHVVMLTGDNEITAKAIGKKAGVDEVIAGVLPEGKEEVIRKLKEMGKVAMVGDGINDAPALTRADIGIAIGAGTDVAIDAADIVLMKSRLTDVAAAIRLSKATLRNIRQNLFWAFFYNVIGIPLAAGLWIPIFGWELNPMFGAAAMSLSSFCVVTNTLRLNLFPIYRADRDKPIKHSLRQENKDEERKEEKLWKKQLLLKV
jgi:Cu2+-exporting ATPase